MIKNRLIYFKALFIQMIKMLKIRFKGASLQYIEIETLNQCNGSCTFCPVNVKRDIREHMMMSDELFYKIIGELERMNYEGHLALFSNNEPLLDKRLSDFAAYARKKLPNAVIFLYTNGILLTAEVLNSLLPSLDFIHIDNYSDSHELRPNIKMALDGVSREDYQKKIELCFRNETEVLTTRGGLNSEILVKIPRTGCILPFIQMVIRPDGKVSLCCNDCYGKWTLGDLNNEKIIDIWNGRRYMSIRNTLLKEGRIKLSPCCSGCNTLDNRSF